MRLTWQRQRLRTRHRFATSQGGISEKETLVVQVEHDGLAGYGEAVPSTLYGQTLESAEAALAAMQGRLGDDPFALETTVQRWLAAYDNQRGALAGVEAALYDWCGKRLGVPLWRLLGLEGPRVRTTFTIGISEPEDVRAKTEAALAAGFDALKVKVGVEHDEQTLSAIREVFDGPLFLDANQAWRAIEAVDRVSALARFRPALVEQPVSQSDWQCMAELRKLGVAPIFADESCQRPADVLRLRGFVDGVNIKLEKCGGVRQALRMIALARELGLQVMVGCFVSSSLAIAPALAIASLADYADLDGALLLADDPFEGIDRSGALLRLGDRPGLGVWPRGGA